MTDIRSEVTNLYAKHQANLDSLVDAHRAYVNQSIPMIQNFEAQGGQITTLPPSPQKTNMLVVKAMNTQFKKSSDPANYLAWYHYGKKIFPQAKSEEELVIAFRIPTVLLANQAVVMYKNATKNQSGPNIIDQIVNPIGRHTIDKQISTIHEIYKQSQALGIDAFFLDPAKIMK